VSVFLILWGIVYVFRMRDEEKNAGNGSAENYTEEEDKEWFFSPKEEHPDKGISADTLLGRLRLLYPAALAAPAAAEDGLSS